MTPPPSGQLNIKTWLISRDRYSPDDEEEDYNNVRIQRVRDDILCSSCRGIQSLMFAARAAALPLKLFIVVVPPVCQECVQENCRPGRPHALCQALKKNYLKNCSSGKCLLPGQTLLCILYTVQCTLKRQSMYCISNFHRLQSGIRLVHCWIF